MNKVVIFLLLILAAFSWYLSHVSGEVEELQATIKAQDNRIEKLTNAEEAEKQKAAARRDAIEKLETAADIEKVRADTSEEMLKSTQKELARLKAREQELSDLLDQSGKNLQQLHKQLTEAREEIKRARAVEDAEPRVRTQSPEF